MQIGELLLKDERRFGLDLPTFNIHRGRDYGLGSYNDYREMCGLPRGKTWKDFHDVLDPEVRKKFIKNDLNLQKIQNSEISSRR